MSRASVVAPQGRIRSAPRRSRPNLRVVRSEPRATRQRVSNRTALLVVVAALCMVGLVMVMAASGYTSLVDYGSVWSIFVRQVIWMALGGIAMAATVHLDVVWWRKLRGVMVVGTLLLLVAVLIPGVGVRAGGSSRWIGFGQLRLQPSELMKLSLVVFGADLLDRRAKMVANPRAAVVPMIAIWAVSAGLVVLQPDMGTAVVLSCITFALLYVGGVPLRPIAKVLGAMAVLAVLVGLADPYRRARLLSFLDPFAHRSGSGYQVVQSLVGLGSGRLYGLGLGAGTERWGLLPNAHTDFIFSVIGQETGLIGAIAILGLFMALAWFGFRAALAAPDRYQFLLATAITCWIMTEAAINVGAVIGLLPVTGIPLPFISFGGSSLVVTMAAVGILVNIAGAGKGPVRQSAGRGPVRQSAGKGPVR